MRLAEIQYGRYRGGVGDGSGGGGTDLRNVATTLAPTGNVSPTGRYKYALGDNVTEEHDHKGDYLITLQEVCRRTGLNKNVIYDYIRKYNSPRPVKMPGGRASRWWSNEVDAWMAALPRAVGDLGRWAGTADGGRTKVEP